MNRLTPILAVSLFFAVAGATAAGAGQSPYPVHVERQRGERLVIDHTPPPRTVGVVRRTTVVRKHRVGVRKVHRRRESLRADDGEEMPALVDSRPGHNTADHVAIIEGIAAAVFSQVEDETLNRQRIRGTEDFAPEVVVAG